jgi:hypothetical protein
MAHGLDDPYNWWVHQRVDVLRPDGSWTLGEVIEADHAVMIDISDGVERKYFYKADEGESDGSMRVILMEGGERGEFVDCEIYPSPPFGIVPGVTPHVTWPPELLAWWRELSTEAKAQLSLDPDEAVPEPVLAEVTRSGATLTASYWTSAQAGPDGFHLPAPHRAMIRDIKLVRAYVRAEQALAAAEKVGSITTADRQLRSRRDQAKVALDEHRRDELPV